MPRMKNRNKDGYMELEVPLVTMETCNNMAPGQVLQIDGSVRKGEGIAMGVQVRANCHNDALIFTLTASEEGSRLSKLLVNKWTCVLSAISAGSTFIDTSSDTNENMMLHAPVDVNGGGVNFTSSINNAFKEEDMKESLSGSLFTQLEYHEEQPEVDDLIINDHKDEDFDPQDDDISDQGYDVDDENAQCSEDLQNVEDHEEFDELDDNMSDSSFELDPPSTSDKLHIVRNKTVQDSDNVEMRECRFCHKYSGSLPILKHELGECLLNPWGRKTLFPQPSLSERHPLPCPHCPRGFKNKSRKNKHVKNCPRDPVYMAQFDREEMGLVICDICDLMCASEFGLHHHQAKAHRSLEKFKLNKLPNEKSYALCKFCGRQFKSNPNRNAHERMYCKMNPDMIKVHHCNICGYSSHLPERISDHMVKHQLPTERYVCEICGKVELSHKRLYQHRIYHAEVRQRSVKCDKCDQMFFDRTKLKRHLAQAHSDVRNVPCPACGKCFKTKQTQRQHYQKVHENSYKFYCDKCGHGMDQLKYLKSHVCGRVRRKQTDGDETEITSDVPQHHDGEQEVGMMLDGKQEVPVMPAGKQEVSEMCVGKQELSGVVHGGKQEVSALDDGTQDVRKVNERMMRKYVNASYAQEISMVMSHAVTQDGTRLQARDNLPNVMHHGKEHCQGLPYGMVNPHHYFAQIAHSFGVPSNDNQTAHSSGYNCG